MELNASALEKFMVKLLSNSDFEYFRHALHQYQTELESYRISKQASNTRPSGNTQSHHLIPPPNENKIKEIVIYALKKAGLEKSEKAWADFQEPIIRAYSYKLTDYEIGLTLSNTLKTSDFLYQCCHEAFPSSKVFGRSKTIIMNDPIKGEEPETKAPFESISGSINGVRFHIFMIEYFSGRPSGGVVAGKEPFSVKNHPFKNIKERIIKEKQDSQTGAGCFWFILVCLVVCAFFFREHLPF